MADWSPQVECPECSSNDTRLIEPKDEVSVYECNVCGCRFETEE